MANGYGRMQIFATTSGKPLAQLICNLLSVELGDARTGRFNDGEIDEQILENVRGHDVFIIAPTHAPADNFMEAIHLAEAARLSSAGRVTIVVPYLGYARSDRKDQPRKPVGVKVALELLEIPRPDRLIVFDIHAEQSLACVRNTICDHLYGSKIGVPHIAALLGSERNYVVASPDRGGGARAAKYARLLSGTDEFVFFSKNRKAAGEVEADSIQIIGDVSGRVVIFVDDMIDTGGTIIADATAAKAAGAKKVWVFATHGLFSKDALTRIDHSVINRVFVTDSVWHEPAAIKAKTKKVEILSCSGLLAQAIRRTHEGVSLSELIL